MWQAIQTLMTPQECGPLNPPSRPLGIWAFHCQHQNTVAFKIMERFSLRDNMTVHEATTNQECFKVTSQMVSVRARKDLHDTSGNHLCHFSKKVISINNAYTGQSPDGRTLFEIKSPILSMSLRPRLNVEFSNAMAGGQRELLEVQGDFLQRNASVLHNGQVVAQIGRSFINFNQIFSEKQTYVLTVAPGVDAALMVAVCIALEQKRNDDASASAGANAHAH